MTLCIEYMRHSLKKTNYKGTVLVVDDDKNIRMTISEILNDSGFKVITAEDGKQALSELNNAIPDIILLDIMMSGMNGIEVLKSIKEKDIPCPVSRLQPLFSFSWTDDKRVLFL
ncbi:MAG: response regulator [Deltaproteobacteria bacterium]|nr:response regulator [Deltaproteobacteria bacterium]